MYFIACVVGKSMLFTVLAVTFVLCKICFLQKIVSLSVAALSKAECECRKENNSVYGQIICISTLLQLFT